jgi:regulatory protein
VQQQDNGFLFKDMMERVITALSVQKRNPNRVNVFLDGEYAFGLGRITAAWLRVGQVLDEEKIAQLQTEDNSEMAYQHALRYLSYRPRTQAEIRKYLSQRETPQAAIEQILERLEQLGQVNDQQFARIWVENRSEFRPRSRRALKIELRQRGIDPQVIEESLETLDEEALARQAALKHARQLRNFDWQTFRQKMVAFLARRGFSYEISATAAAQAWTEFHTENTEYEEVDE